MIAVVSDADEARKSILLDDSLRLDHVAIAVRRIASARLLYEALGMSMSAEETVEHEQVMTAMFSLGESRLELIEPISDDATVSKFLTKRGEGLHHIAIHAENLDAKFADLKAKGVRLASDSIRIGAGGHRYFFVHPESAGGVLVEIVGDAIETGEQDLR